MSLESKEVSIREGRKQTDRIYQHKNEVSRRRREKGGEREDVLEERQTTGSRIPRGASFQFQYSGATLRQSLREKDFPCPRSTVEARQ
jgi:hypothetical protein